MRGLVVLKALALAMALCTAGAAAAQDVACTPDQAARAAKFRIAIGAELARNHVPGGTWALVDGGCVTVGGAGLAPGARLPLGGVSKTLTSVGVLALADEGAFRLDDPVGRYLPEFAKGPLASLTIRQLLVQTSGIRDAGAPAPGLTLRGYVREIAATQPAEPPGRAFRDANANYAVLAAVIEAAAQQPFADYMAGHVFGPLGMGETTVGPDGMAVAAGHQWRAAVAVPASGPVPRAWAPAVGIVSTAPDLGRFLQFELGAVPSATLTPVEIEMTHLPLTGAGPGVGFGMGWFSPLRGGGPFHDGMTAVSSSTIALRANGGAGMAVLSNVGGLTAKVVLAPALRNVFDVPAGAEAIKPRSVVLATLALLSGFVLAGVVLLLRAAGLALVRKRPHLGMGLILTLVDLVLAGTVVLLPTLVLGANVLDVRRAWLALWYDYTDFAVVLAMMVVGLVLGALTRWLPRRAKTTARRPAPRS